MLNALSIDVEDWFCAHNLATAIPYEKWGTIRLRVSHNMDRILELLHTYDTRATFFILGWVAEQSPDIVRRIRDHGHEIATHGYSHSFVNKLTHAQFRHDLERSLDVLYRACPDVTIRGFRAPSFSVNPEDTWVFETLSTLGFSYDTSLFPVSIHPTYSNPGIPLHIYRTHHNIIEFPMSCFRLCGLNLPCAGGGYFRMLPYWYTSLGIHRCHAHRRPVIFYIHPWEIDPNVPHVKYIPLIKRIRHYKNLGKTETRLRQLLEDFSFDTIYTVLNHYGHMGETTRYMHTRTL
jgi:polysaccharide deacetylase family protein (PEP-CTERM system associated)